MKTQNWGIIGSGGIASRRTIPALMQIADSKIVGVMDIGLETANNVAKKFNIEKYYDNVDAILADESIDIIYIATPLKYHKEQALKAIAAKKNVFIEKPMAMNFCESKEILDAAKKNNVGLMIGYIMRYHNLHQKIKEIISSGKLGQIVNAKASFSCWYPEIYGAWRQNKAISGGGAVMDLGVHCIDILQFVLDDKIERTMSLLDTKTFNYKVEDSAVIIGETSKKAFVNITVNFNIPDRASKSKLEIYGTKGVLVADGTLGQEETGELKCYYDNQENYDANQSIEEIIPEIMLGNNENIYLKQAVNFIEMIGNGKFDYTFAENSAEIQKIVDKIYGI